MLADEKRERALLVSTVDGEDWQLGMHCGAEILLVSRQLDCCQIDRDGCDGGTKRRRVKRDGSK